MHSWKTNRRHRRAKRAVKNGFACAHGAPTVEGAEMKKAKDYARDFMRAALKGVAPGPLALQVVKDMCIEIDEIGNMRHAQSNEAMTAIILEQSRKWKAFVERVPKRFGIKRSGFALYFRDKFGDAAGMLSAETLSKML